jgi:hypothetical protein
MVSWVTGVKDHQLSLGFSAYVTGCQCFQEVGRRWNIVARHCKQHSTVISMSRLGMVAVLFLAGEGAALYIADVHVPGMPLLEV